MTRLVIAATAVLVLLAGCSASAPTAPAAKPAEVALKNLQFSPQDLTVATGTTVTWTNQEEMPHDVTGKDQAWQSSGGQGGLKNGMSFAKTFTVAGVYEYYCTLHSSGPGNAMSGKIVVQ